MLKRRLDIRQVPNTKLIEIGVTSSDPNEAATLANAVAESYSRYRTESRRALTSEGLGKLKEIYAQQARRYPPRLRQRWRV